jgi:hypothetical protein
LDRRRAGTLFQELAEVNRPQPVADGNARQEGAREALQQVVAMLNHGL